MKKYSDPEILALSLGGLNTNCYLTWCRESREAVIIDPADDGGYITDKITELDLKPLCIVLTHGHFDHVLATLELKLNFDVPIFIHENDISLLADAQKSAKYWLKRDVDPIPPTDSYISQGSTLDFGACSLEVIETPGHTPGSVSLASLGNKPIIFTGDTLFKNGIGRTDFKYSNPTDMERSLQKLFRYDKNTICYPGHGDPTTIDDEK